MVPALPMGMALEGGEGREDMGVGVQWNQMPKRGEGEKVVSMLTSWFTEAFD